MRGSTASGFHRAGPGDPSPSPADQSMTTNEREPCKPQSDRTPHAARNKLPPWPSAFGKRPAGPPAATWNSGSWPSNKSGPFLDRERSRRHPMSNARTLRPPRRQLPPRPQRSPPHSNGNPARKLKMAARRQTDRRQARRRRTASAAHPNGRQDPTDMIDYNPGVKVITAPAQTRDQGEPGHSSSWNARLLSRRAAAPPEGVSLAGTETVLLVDGAPMMRGVM